MNYLRYFKALITTLLLLLTVAIATPVNAVGTIFINDNGDVGIGTNTPDEDLDIESDGPSFRLTNLGSGAGIWDFRMNSNTARFVFTDDPTGSRVPVKIGTGANNNLLKIGINAINEVRVTGNLVVTGSITPDYVFKPEYKLESIADHAKYMWEKHHLPSIEKAINDDEGRGIINIGARSQGLLEELEKAHIYIEQVNKKVESLKEVTVAQSNYITGLKKNTRALESMIAKLNERLSNLESN